VEIVKFLIIPQIGTRILRNRSFEH